MGDQPAVEAQSVASSLDRSSTPDLDSEISTPTGDGSASVRTELAGSVDAGHTDGADGVYDQPGRVCEHIPHIPRGHGDQAGEDDGEFDGEHPMLKWQTRTDDPWSVPKMKGGENATQRLAHLESWLADIDAQFPTDGQDRE